MTSHFKFLLFWYSPRALLGRGKLGYRLERGKKLKYLNPCVYPRLGLDRLPLLGPTAASCRLWHAGWRRGWVGGLDRAESGALGKVLMASRYFVYKHFYCNCVPVVVWYEKICMKFLNLLGILQLTFFYCLTHWNIDSIGVQKLLAELTN